MHTLLYQFFFFNDTATTEIYTLSLHDALPILYSAMANGPRTAASFFGEWEETMATWSKSRSSPATADGNRSEEHTSELQSRFDLVCRLLLEKKNYTL